MAPVALVLAVLCVTGARAPAAHGARTPGVPQRTSDPREAPHRQSLPLRQVLAVWRLHTAASASRALQHSLPGRLECSWQANPAARAERIVATLGSAS